MKTIRGVYLDLNESDIFYKFDEFKFYFSSKFNKQRFEKNLKNYITTESLKMKNKYHIEFKGDLFFSLAFYKKIEKRGFRIEEITSNNRLSERTIIINKFL